jgi:hypothetical protein
MQSPLGLRRWAPSERICPEADATVQQLDPAARIVLGNTSFLRRRRGGSGSRHRGRKARLDIDRHTFVTSSSASASGRVLRFRITRIDAVLGIVKAPRVGGGPFHRATNAIGEAREEGAGSAR